MNTNLPLELGGGLHPEFDGMTAEFKDAYSGLGYINIELPDRRTLALFINTSQNLLVADVIDEDGRMGFEFVRTQWPQSTARDESGRLPRPGRQPARRMPNA